jgi:HlyD family secretion protein
VNVIADFAEDLPREELLGDAFRVEASIVIWEADDVIKVPSGALFRSGEKWAAFVVRAGRAVRRMVEIGKNNGREAQVLSGLSPDDVVIVFPSDEVHDSARVQAMR